MRWIDDVDEFKRVHLEARRCVFIDSGREETTLQRLEFDDAELQSDEFFGLIKMLMQWASDTTATYVVLDPDPVYFFRDQFGKYPAIELFETDSGTIFLETLNRELNGNAAAAIGVNYREFAIFSPSQSWFVHAMQSPGQRGGHLWVPSGWMERIRKVYPYAHPPVFVRRPPDTSSAVN
jgi:hypothetical protein